MNNEEGSLLIAEFAIRRPIHDLVRLWHFASLVHESITSLTHEHHGNAFKITWSFQKANGVASSDTFTRGFNEGIKYPNVGLNGLRDFEHIRVVDKISK